ncbi:putative ribonuclease H-like domain-containing protein [Tanacetum coccineum]
MLASQITDKSKKGLGYHVVAPPYPLSINAPKILDLSYSGLDEFKEPEFIGYGPRDTGLKPTINCDKESDNSKENTNDSLREQVSEDENSSVESSPNVDKETIFHTAKKGEIKEIGMIKYPQRKGRVTGNNYNRVDYDYYAKTSHLNIHKNMTPRAVLLKSGLKPFSTARPVYTAHPKPTVWRPTRPNGASLVFNRYNYIDARGMPQMNDTGFVDSGCSRHMTKNITYLSNFKEFDGGYVTFGGGAYGGRITGKNTLKTDSLDFEDVYFVKELKSNLLSVSQMCAKKNYVLFTDTECHVLSPNFKLPDDSQILLKIPRKDNMYSFDMKNIVPKESLTCLVAKATLDESMLWHRRLGHINFKNINKLVKENLVRGLPLKRFENDQTCVACLKRKQHRASCKSKRKGIRKEYSVARTPQQNGVAERRNRTLIEAARTIGFKPALSFMRPFGCHVTILNTLDNLGKFDGKSDEGSSTKKDEISQDCIMMPIWKDASYFDSPSKDICNDEPKSADDVQEEVEDGPNNKNDEQDKSKDNSSPKEVNAAGQLVNTASPRVNTGSSKLNIVDPSVNTTSSYDHDRPKDMFKLCASHTLEATHVEFFSNEDEPEVDLGNIPNSYPVPTTPHTRIHKDHAIMNVIGDVKSPVQTRRMTQNTNEQGFISAVYEGKTHEDLYTCLFACFLSHEEPKRISKALRHRAIGTKWIFRNKKYERGIVIRNKARLVAHGHTQEEGIDYDEVFTPVARIKAIRLFLAYASFMGFMVYQMDVKSTFLYGQIKEEVYVCQTLGFEDPDYPEKVYKIYVDDIIFGSTNKELCTGFEKLIKDKFQMSSMGELTFFLGLQVQQRHDGIFISQDKYVDEILKKFNYTDVKSTSTLVDLEKPLVKDRDGNDVDEHLYRSMIGSLMYLTTSRPDIMFVVCACARFQVTPKTSHLTAVKRIFRYLKGKPTLGLWYSSDSLFELVAYTHSDYARTTQDRKSTTGGCQFLGNRLISWQCKKQTVVATSTTEAEFVAAASCCGQVSDEAVHKELGDRMERAATTASSLEAEQDSEFYDKHNMVAYLLKSEGSEGFHQIIDFLNASYIKYALTENPTIYASFIKQFWRTPTTSIDSNGQVELIASIDGQEKTITKASLRRHLKLVDSYRLTYLLNSETFEQLALIGYETDYDKLTFQKGNFSPRWRFLIHTILHCLSPKKTAWE